MEKKDVICEFYSREYEKSVNRMSIYYSFVTPKDEIRRYIDRIISVPIDEYVNYDISSKQNDGIVSDDIFQFSNFEDASYNICVGMKKQSNPGIKHIDAGRILLDDGLVRNEVAYVKYGENHLKCAELLGLVFDLNRTYFLSCLGMIIDEISKEERDKLIVRMIVRNKLVSVLIKETTKSVIELRNLFGMLSDSTYLRRRSSVKRILKVLLSSDEYDFSSLYNGIVF